MFGRTVGIATNLALAANAFLLPPNLSSTGGNKDVSNLLSPVDSTLAKNTLITAPCSSCAFPAPKPATIENENGEEEPAYHIAGGANSILFDVKVSEDGKKVLINGMEGYPEIVPLDGNMEVYQVPSKASIEAIQKDEVAKAPLKVTGFGMGHSSEEILSEDGDKTASVRFDITSLNKHDMTVNALEVKVLQLANGDVMILETNIIDPLPQAPAFKKEKPSHEDGDNADQHHACPSMIPSFMCNMISKMEDKMESLRNGHHGFHGFGGKPDCPGKHAAGEHPHQMPGHIRPHFLAPGSHHHGPPPVWIAPGGMHHGPPHHHGHHSHHNQHSHSAPSFLKAFLQGLVAVLIPVMAGIAVGLVVSVLGLMTGRFIGFLWFRIARGGQRGYASVAQQEEGESDGVYREAEGVRKASLESTETLPRYEDAPAYEETEGEKQ
ncbi:hypothetical protein MBLNU230_g3151t1 [Neophaeotheca triangularis]